jgi:hypothetical protein
MAVIISASRVKPFSPCLRHGKNGFIARFHQWFHAVSWRFHHGFTRFHWDGFIAGSFSEISILSRFHRGFINIGIDFIGEFVLSQTTRNMAGLGVPLCLL